MNNLKTVSVVVRARNEERSLPALIYGLAAQTLRPTEVLLVDSGSDDATRQLASEAGWKVLKIPPEQFSYGRSLNLGCHHATGEILVSLSAHTRPIDRQFLANLTEPCFEDHDLVVYGRQVGGDESNFSEKVLMKAWFPQHDILAQGHAFANNANSAFSKALWSRLKFNEELPALEDVEFSLACLKNGGRVAYSSAPAIVHIHDEDPLGVRKRYEREAEAMRRIFPGQKMSGLRALGLFLSNSLNDFAEAASDYSLHKHFQEIVSFRSNQFIGAWRGFRKADKADRGLMKRMYEPVKGGASEPFPSQSDRISYPSELV